MAFPQGPIKQLTRWTIHYLLPWQSHKEGEVPISVDIMMVAGIPNMMTISRHIKFGSAGKLDNIKNGHKLKHFKTLTGMYVIRNCTVTIMLADNQSEPIRDNLTDLHAKSHITSRDKHIPEIERYNSTINEQCYSNYNIIPFEYLPPIMVMKMVHTVVF